MGSLELNHIGLFTSHILEWFNPIRTGWMFSSFLRFFANNFGSSTVTHSKLRDFS